MAAPASSNRPSVGQIQPAAAATASTATIDELPGIHAQLSFWQRPFVQNVLPLVMSLSLHTGLVLAGWLTLKAVVQVMRPDTVEQINIPSVEIVEGAPVGGIKNPGLGNDPNRRTEQDQLMNVPADADGWATKKSQSMTASLLGGGSGEDESGMIAMGAGGFGSGGGVGAGKGAGIGGGSGDSTGPLAPFGVPGGGGGLGPKARFLGVSGNARRISYVCDASGSMMNKFDGLRLELHKSIDKLVPSQSFNVIFFQEDKAASIDKGLIVANPESKRKAYDFLEKTSAHGTTDPISAMKLAFDQNPQLIYLLTDGDFDQVGNEAVEKYIAERNANKQVKISTIAFVSRGEEYEKVLKRIADQNGGIFKYVSDEELGR